MRKLFADTETAGLDPKDGVVEIALIEVDSNLDPIETFHSLIDPQGPISPSASGVHGIIYEDVKDAPTLDQFFETTGAGQYAGEPLYMVGHNIPFDINFIGHKFHPEIVPVCTLRLARHLYPDAENHKLQTLRYQFGLEAGDAHSAHGDTILCLNFFRRMMEEFGFTFEEMAILSARPIHVKKMPFGKHKGTPLDQLPRGYRHWLLNTADIDEDLRHSLLNM